MALFNKITIEKVIIKIDSEILERIEKKLDEFLEDPKGEKKKEIFDKLSAAIDDIKSTV